MGFLNQHPFAVEARFEKSLVLGFALPKAELLGRIPKCLQLDLFEDQWAFVAVAMVKTEGLRPRGLPRFFGRNFTLIGYRIFVRYRSADGRLLRGLYILGSETDSKMMQGLGSLFTQYQYSTLAIDWESGADGSERVVSSEGLEVLASKVESDVALPQGSPFVSWKQARQFAGPMPFTFSYDEKKQQVIIVEGKRSVWQPQAMSVDTWKVPFLEKQGFDQTQLANAFLVENVPYEWEKGRVETWRP
ncbi:MAG: DUF2071 domain-containing protein [Verrucomicrobiota bacterium]